MQMVIYMKRDLQVKKSYVEYAGIKKTIQERHALL